jgi:Ca-activated chloride channel family protein
MTRGRIAVIALAVVAIVIAFVGSRGDSKGRGGGSRDRTANATRAPARALRLEFVYSPEKAALVKQLVAGFNAAHVRVRGRTVVVDARNVASGDAETRIAAGRLKPVVWSPASSLWGRLLDYDADEAYVPDANPSLVRTPLVIAMWEPMARALGWPRQRVGFEQILALARSPSDAWARRGHPEFGPFKLGHTNPDFSTSGLSAVAGEYYAATGKRSHLTTDDVDSARVRREIKQVERSIVHYGDTTLFFSQQLAKYGRGYASAVAMEEATLIDFNEHAHKDSRLVALYPPGGTFNSDDPVIVLQAPWVSAEMREAANAFSRWIRGKATPPFVARFGFRPGDPSVAPAAPIDRAHGADPSEPRTTLELPDPGVLSRIKELWHVDRKPAKVLLVVDTSRSMGQQAKMQRAKAGLAVFLRRLAPQDRVGLMSFSNASSGVVPIGRSSHQRDDLLRGVESLKPKGNTALYAATRTAVDRVRAVRDPSRINAVVLLSDGHDTTTTSTEADLLRELRLQSPVRADTVRVFTIAYGGQADSASLKRIASATGGQEFTGDPNGIADVYRSISSLF